MRSTTFVILFGVLSATLITACSDVYGDLLSKQGYTAMEHPRSDFGTGTIIRKKPLEVFVASQEECFPGMENKIHLNPIQLSNAKDTSNLSSSVGAKYVPGGVDQIGASLGFKTVKTLDVSFGKTTANDLTVEGFAQYLDGTKISKRCLAYLADPANRILISAARVETLAFTFHGEKNVDAKVDDSALKNALSTSGVVNYVSTSDHNLSVSQPMYIAYRAAKFEDLGVVQPESPDSLVELKKENFRLTGEN